MEKKNRGSCKLIINCKRHKTDVQMKAKYRRSETSCVACLSAHMEHCLSCEALINLVSHSIRRSKDAAVVAFYFLLFFFPPSLSFHPFEELFHSNFFKF